MANPDRFTRSVSRHLPFGEKRDTRFYGMHIVSVQQFDRQDLDTIFEVAREMRSMVERVGSFDLLKGKVLANLFYESSTRTSSPPITELCRVLVGTHRLGTVVACSGGPL